MESIYKEYHRTKGQAKGTIVLVHGTGEHCGRYKHVIETFNAEGYHCMTGDLPGFGRSSGKRGHIESYDHYLTVVNGWIEEARAKEPSLPLFLFGHSMGGLITTLYVIKYGSQGLSGLLLSSPFYKLAVKVPKWKEVGAKFIYRIAPTISINSGVTGAHVSRDANVIDDYDNDPLNVKTVTPLWHHESEQAMAFVDHNAEKVSLPVCAVVAGTERLVSPEQTNAYFSRFSTNDKTMRVWEQSYHELLNEPEKEEVLAFILGWLNSHVS